MRKKFNVFGMTCSSCQAHVEKAVQKLDGIKNVNVNLLSNTMFVEFDEKVLDENVIINAVADAGYNAKLISNNDIKVDKEVKKMKKRLIYSVIFWIILMYVAMHGMMNQIFNIPIPNFISTFLDGPENALKFVIVQIILLIPIVVLNRNYFKVGIKRLFKLSPNMDSLIAIGSGAAIIYGLFASFKILQGISVNNLELVNRYLHDIYFESAGTILTLITIGKYLESNSKGKTTAAIEKLINLTPKTAKVLQEDGNESEVLLENIKVNDIVVIRPGDIIPVDGIIIEGSSNIDQSTITGESVPIEKVVGDEVISGTVNKNGSFNFKANKVGENTTISQIVKLVEEAANSKAPISRIADKVSGVFVPIVIIIAIIAAIVWVMLGQSFEFALSIAISILVISCPCALGLATPVAIMVGTGKGAENGILIKSAESLELLHSVTAVVLDKTGTITEGKPKVTDIIDSQKLMSYFLSKKGNIKFVSNVKNDEKMENNLLMIAGSLELKSEHPLAEAIVEIANIRKIKIANVDNFEAISGRGIKGSIDGKEYFGGNILFMKENNIEIDENANFINKMYEQGKTLLFFANSKELIGIIAVADTIKPSSKKGIKKLKNENIKVLMVTGDNKITANSIANEVGIDNVISDVLPQDKEMIVKKLQEENNIVAFVGDGINDSPALVKADVGLAIGSGTDIAIDSADIVLIKNSLLDVVNAIDLSKAVIKNIKMNLFWAFIYNIIGIPVAAGLLYSSFNIKLSPMIGAAAMSLSSVCVVTNVLRLRKFNGIKETNLCEDNKCKLDIKEKKEKNNMKTIVVEGMHCNHCKMSVEKVLKSIDGVVSAEVNLESKEAVINTSKEVNNNDIIKAITEEGFEVKEIKE